MLPFKPLVAESQDEAFQMGMAETLIFKLSNLKQLSVRSINSVRKYANLGQDPLAAGREQRADFVLENSFQRDGDKIRVKARLLNVADGTALWTHQCDEQYCANLFVMQDAISEKVAAALSLHLTGVERERLRKHYTENKEAYQLYMKGRHWWTRKNVEGFKKAIEYFEQAIQKDPNYALAYAGLADCYALLSDCGHLPAKEGYSRARGYATSALAIDHQLAEAHLSMANIKCSYDWDWAGAEGYFKQALELKPTYSRGRHWRAQCLCATERFHEAIAEGRLAQELEQLSPSTNWILGDVFYLARQYDQAIEQEKMILEMDRTIGPAYFILGKAYKQKGMYKESITAFQEWLKLIPDNPDCMAHLGHAYAVSGRRNEARKILDQLWELSKQRFVSPYNMAIIYTGLGDKDQAFVWLKKAYDERVNWLNDLKAEPLFDSLRPDPRFAELLRGMNLAP